MMNRPLQCFILSCLLFAGKPNPVDASWYDVLPKYVGNLVEKMEKMVQACPRRNDGVAFTRESLNRNIFGQDEAIKRIVRALHPTTLTKPRVMHFAGENGVGKTLAATLIGKGLFDSVVKGVPRGVLWISGHDLALPIDVEKNVLILTNEEIERRRTFLRDRIAEHLYKCREGMVVIDEAYIINRRIIDVIEPLISGGVVSYKGKSFTVSDALFIIVTDFGSEGLTAGKSLREMENFIDEEVKQIWRNSRLAALVDMTVPFLPMERQDIMPAAVVKMICFLVDHLREDVVYNTIDVIYFDVDRQSLADFIYKEVVSNSVFRDRNYRGIEQVFNEHVRMSLMGALSAFSADGGSGLVEAHMTILDNDPIVEDRYVWEHVRWKIVPHSFKSSFPRGMDLRQEPWQKQPKRL